MKELYKKTFELFFRYCEIKRIDRLCNKHRNLKIKLDVLAFNIHNSIRNYEAKYGEIKLDSSEESVK